MSNTKKEFTAVSGNILKALCMLASAGLVAASVVLYGASLRYMIIAAAFSIFYVILPGLYLTRLSGCSDCRISTRLAFSVFAGWAFNILIYFVSDVLPTDILLYAAAPVLSAMYISGTVRGSEDRLIRGRFRFGRLSTALCVFMALLLFFCIASVQYNYMSPELADYTIMNSDKAYHIGLINSLSHDYPLESPWVSGKFITYHIFSEVLLSLPVRLFSVPADFMMLSFGPIWTSFVLGLSLYSFFREMSGRPERAGAYSLILLLSNIYLARTASTSLAFKFAFENDNSSGYGIAASLITIIAFRRWYTAFENKAPGHGIRLGMLVIFTMLVTGIKGPMGAVLIAAMWGTILLGIILRKVPPKALIPLMVSTAGFILIYKTILNGRGTSNATGQSIIAFAKIADISFWKAPLVDALKASGMSYPLRIMILLAVFIVFYLTIFLLPFCIGYIRELILVLSGKKPYEPHRVLVYAAFAVGFILMMIMNYSGHSQVYFGLLAVFLVPVISFWFIEDMEDLRDISAAARHTLRLTVSVMALTLILTSVSYADCMNSRISEARRELHPSGKPDKYMSVSRDEYEAMVWLSKNTEKDALLATDRYYSVPLKEYSIDNRWSNRFFLYANYSNRFTYISGSGYNIPDSSWELRKEMLDNNRRLYDPENDDRGDDARELGVDYVVVSKRFTKLPDLSNEDYEKFFTNDDIVVYKIAG